MPAGFRHFILSQHEVVPVDFHTWAVWFESADGQVAEDFIGAIECPDKLVRISTVFIGIDLNPFRRNRSLPAHVFETMIFGGEHTCYCRRSATWKDAIEAHQEAVRLANEKAWRAKI